MTDAGVAVVVHAGSSLDVPHAVLLTAAAAAFWVALAACARLTDALLDRIGRPREGGPTD